VCVCICNMASLKRESNGRNCPVRKYPLPLNARADSFFVAIRVLYVRDDRPVFNSET